MAGSAAAAIPRTARELLHRPELASSAGAVSDLLKTIEDTAKRVRD